MSNTETSDRNKIVEIIQKDINNYVFQDYNFEISITCCQKYLILSLNILTGGVGTLLLPFINKNRDHNVMKWAGILIGIFQILHFLHFFSLLTNVKILDDFYGYICDDKILESVFGNYENDKEFENINEIDKDSLKNLDENDTSSILGFVVSILKLNLSETIPKDKKIKYLKIFFGILSGMSYANSIFTSLIIL